MRIYIAVVGLLVLAVAQISCTTMNFKVYKYETGLGDSDIGISLTDSPWSYTIFNNTDSDVSLSPGKSAFVLNGESNRVITGDSKISNSDTASTDLPIGPHSKKTVMLIPPELIQMTYENGWKIKWLRELSSGDKIEFRFAFMMDDGKVVRKTINGSVQELKTKVTDTNEIACYATAIIYGGWCWLLPTSSDIDKAKQEAKEKFGEKALLDKPRMSF